MEGFVTIDLGGEGLSIEYSQPYLVNKSNRLFSTASDPLGLGDCVPPSKAGASLH